MSVWLIEPETRTAACARPSADLSPATNLACPKTAPARTTRGETPPLPAAFSRW
jgi:hypothetical protein